MKKSNVSIIKWEYGTYKVTNGTTSMALAPDEARDLLRQLREVLGEKKCCKGCPDCQAIGPNGSVI